MNAPLARPLVFHKPGDTELERRLRGAVQGDVLFDRASRGRYSTDASIYQVEPVGVLVPKSHDDVRVAVEECRSLGVPLLARGGGSSQCGQTVGAALVVDHSKHLTGVVAFDRDANVDAVIGATPARISRYGRSSGSDWRLGEVAVSPPWTRFEVLRGGAAYAGFRTRMIGTHNLLNALADIAVADHLGLSAAEIGAGLETFSGVRRRQEVRGEARGMVVIDDFAHHPTAIRETLGALRARGTVGRIVAVLEPRSNTMKLGSMKAALPGSLEGADRVFCYAGGVGWDVAEALAPLGERATVLQQLPELVDAIVAESRPGDRVVVMSNGGFGGIHARLLDQLRNRPGRAA
jgi:UDP-N-acetylmuramate-alanine ligase